MSTPIPIKLTCMQADDVFVCDEVKVLPERIRHDLIQGVLEEMVAREGYPALKAYNITKLYELSFQCLKNDDGEDYVPLADVTVDLEDGQQVSFQFVCMF